MIQVFQIKEMCLREKLVEERMGMFLTFIQVVYSATSTPWGPLDMYQICIPLFVSVLQKSSNTTIGVVFHTCKIIK